jgi:hypothetical protein
MYWPDHWEKCLSQPDPAGQATRKREETGDLLDAVIDRTAKKPEEQPAKRRRFTYAVFPTPASESRFKSCLARVPVECRMERKGKKRILALRPKNVQRFDELIRTSGLANCEVATRAVQWLRANPDEFLRFEPR